MKRWYVGYRESDGQPEFLEKTDAEYEALNDDLEAAGYDWIDGPFDSREEAEESV